MTVEISPTKDTRFWPSRGQLLKALITVSLLATLIYKVSWVTLTSVLLDVDISWLALAFTALVVQILFASQRWRLLTDRLGLPGGSRSAVLIYLVSGIAGIIFVASLAVASLRVALHYRLGAPISAGALSTVLEKSLTLLAMILTFSLLAFIPENRALVASVTAQLLGKLQPTSWQMFFYVLGLIGLVTIGYFVLYRLIAKLHKFRSAIKEQTDTLRAMGHYLVRPGMLLALLATSLIAFLLGGGAILLTAKAFSQPLSASTFLFLYPAIALISALPISLGGWGVREGTMVVALGLMNVAPEQALAISIVYALTGIASTGLLGAIAYVILLPNWEIFTRTRDPSSANRRSA